jgi:prepilin-type N-terminal cleavage/methylation domain-containing protein
MTKHAQKGYTLVELVVVIAIAGLLVFTTLTGISNQNETARFGAQVEDIKTAIRGIQTEAASGRGDSIPVGQQIYASRITFAANSYTTYRLSGTTKSWSSIATVTMPTGFSLSAGWASASLVFTVPNDHFPSVASYTTVYADPNSYDPTNQSDRGTVTLTVNSGLGHSATITYNAWGGTLTSAISQ